MNIDAGQEQREKMWGTQVSHTGSVTNINCITVGQNGVFNLYQFALSTDYIGSGEARILWYFPDFYWTDKIRYV